MSQKDHHHGATATDAHAHHEDELIVTPKGQSRFKFFLTMALVLFVLVIFSVGPYFKSAVTSGGQESTYFSWVNPNGNKKTALGYQEFIVTKRALGNMAYFGLYQSASSRKDPNQRGEVSDEDTALFLIQEALAKQLGVQVSDKEVGSRLLSAFGSAEQVQALSVRFGTSARAMQENLRRVMSVQKYTDTQQMAFAIADPAEVETMWGEQHPEYAFETISVAASDYEEAAREENVPDEALQLWFQSRPAYQQQKYHSEDKSSAELAWLTLDGMADMTALLEAYPAPADADVSQLAQSYYNEVTHARFKGSGPKPAPADEDATSSDEDATSVEDETSGSEDESGELEDETSGSEDVEEPQEQELWYRPYEDVEPICAVEAPVRNALQAWVDSMIARTGAGETVDFGAEAASFGLSFAADGVARTKSEMETAPGWGGTYIAGRLAFSTPGTFLSRVVVEENAFVVAKPIEKLPGELRPFDEIRDEVRAEWAADRSKSLAVDALSALRSGFELAEGESNPTVSAEDFQAAAGAAGFEVVERPYLEQYALPNDDFDSASPADMHIRVSRNLFELEPGQVAPAAANAQGTHAILVRYVGTRSAPIDKLKPRDLMTLRQQIIRKNLESFESEYLNGESPELRRRYAIELESWKRANTSDEAPTEPVDVESSDG